RTPLLYSTPMGDPDEDSKCFTFGNLNATELEEIYKFYENFTSEDCNCSRIYDTWHAECAKVCKIDVNWMELLSEIAPPALIYLMVFFVGTIGNILVIFVVNRFKRMRNVTNVFLASLSTADLCLIWICVPVMFVKYMSHGWPFGRFACYSVHYIQQFTCFCSVLTMTMIAIERYMAIAYPMKNIWLSSIGRAKKVILIVWVVSAVLAIPSAMKIEYRITEDQTQYMCQRRFANEILGVSPRLLNRGFAIYEFLILIVFPVATMSICYTRVSLIVYSSNKDTKLLSAAMVAFSKAATDTVTFTSYSSIPIVACRSYKTANATISSLTTSKKSSRVAESNKKQIVQMLISIVVMYTICWLPAIIDEIIISFGYICRTSNTATLKHMRMGFNALTYCQSCLNPVCYAFISQNFRATFKSAYNRMKYRIQGGDELRSRMGSCSSASMLSTRNHHRIGGSFNTLTVPGRSVITPNMSRDVSQLSLCRPRTPNTMVTIDGPSTMIRPRSPTEISRDSGRPRSPTDLSQLSRPGRPGSIIRPRSPTNASQISVVVSTRPRSPTTQSHTSANSVRSLPERQTLLTVGDAMRPKTPDFV
ncbi:hypothetical protein PENTCL1PPCAC_6806, partial [Pristionchus entomophagus]